MSYLTTDIFYIFVAITNLPSYTEEALLVTDVEKYVFSPFYPSQYFRGLKLEWTLRAPPFTVITIKVRSYDLYLQFCYLF